MSVKVVTLLRKVDSIEHSENADVIIDFHNYMREKGLSENHIINNLKS